MNDALQTLVGELLAAAILIVPVAAGVIVTWLKSRDNARAIANSPTYGELNAAIDHKLSEVLNGNGNQAGTAPASPTGPTTTG